MPKLLTLSALSRELGVGRETLRTLAREQVIPCIVTHAGAHRLFDAADVLTALKERRRQYVPRIIPKTDQDARVLRALDEICSK